MPVWWSWATWLDPFSYALRGLVGNEFSAPRWDIPYNEFSSRRRRFTIGSAVLQVGCRLVPDLQTCACGYTGVMPLCSAPACCHMGSQAQRLRCLSSGFSERLSRSGRHSLNAGFYMIANEAHHRSLVFNQRKK